LSTPSIQREPADFSLVLGGPLYQLWRRTRLSGHHLELLRRRIISVVVVTWLPLLVLSILGGSAFGGSLRIPFLYDIENNVRFLVSLPVLIGAELLVHQRLRLVVYEFLERGLIRTEERERFAAIIDSAMKIRNSIGIELALVVLVYTVGHWGWRNSILVSEATWYSRPDGGGHNLTLAGQWLSLVSIPLFQFILARWLSRLFIWYRMMWQISRLDLQLTPTHPDRAGGLGFLSLSVRAFAPILFAVGALLAGSIASRIFFDGQSLLAFQREAVGLVVLLLAAFLGPLAFYSPLLLRTKREGLLRYGQLATKYGRGFSDKWIEGRRPDDEPLMGTADIQSLADLGNSIGFINQMRPMPFGVSAVISLAVPTIAPLLPLTLTVIPLEELIKNLIKVVL
jgi:hypothetical protein